MQENTHVHGCLVAEKPTGVFYSSRSAGAHEPLVLPIKNKRNEGSRKSSRTLRRSFPSPSSSCARVAVSNFSSMTRTESDVRHECRTIRRLQSDNCEINVIGGGHSRSGLLCSFLSKHSIQVGRLYYRRTYIFTNKYHCF